MVQLGDIEENTGMIKYYQLDVYSYIYKEAEWLQIK